MAPASSKRLLRVVLIWHGEPLDERVFAAPQPVSVGPGRMYTFIAPAISVPADFTLFTPLAEGDGYELTLVAGMNGKVTLGREPFAVAELLAERPLYRRTFRLESSDWGILGLDEAGDVAIFFQFVSPSVLASGGTSWLDRLMARHLGLPR